MYTLTALFILNPKDSDKKARAAPSRVVGPRAAPLTPVNDSVGVEVTALTLRVPQLHRHDHRVARLVPADLRVETESDTELQLRRLLLETNDSNVSYLFVAFWLSATVSTTCWPPLRSFAVWGSYLLMS